MHPSVLVVDRLVLHDKEDDIFGCDALTVLLEVIYDGVFGIEGMVGSLVVEEGRLVESHSSHPA